MVPLWECMLMGQEVSPKDWIDIFDVISGEPLVETLPLANSG